MTVHVWPCASCPVAFETLDEVERHEHVRHFDERVARFAFHLRKTARQAWKEEKGEE